MRKKGLWSFIARKAFASIIIIFAIMCINFVIFRMAPGDPIRMMFRDPRINAEQMQQLRAKFGLDKSLSGQFVAYLRQLSKGNLGTSF